MNLRRLSAGLLASALLSLSLGIGLVSPAFGADPFYEQRLREGTRALERGQPEEAARHLRLAAFGFLTDRDLLVESLMRLAQAQADLGDSAAFDATFERLTDVEQRLSWYSQAEHDPDLRQAFEDLVANRVPIDTLRRFPSFADLVRERLAADLDSLPPRPRRERLEQLISEEPESNRWPLLLARLELEQKRPQRTVELTGTILEREPADQGALCARGIAYSRLQNCPAAVTDLARCERARVDLPIAFAQVDCLASLERWQEASAALGALPTSLSGDRSFSRLRRRIDRNLKETAPAPGAAVDQAAAENPVQEDTPPPAIAEETPQPTPPRLSPEDESVQARIQTLLSGARTSGDLDRPAALAADLADRYPDHRDLQLQAAEIYYRASRWSESARYFRRGGDIPANRPGIAFYAAVAYHETGDDQAAEESLRLALPLLKRSPFVESYIERILGANAP